MTDATQSEHDVRFMRRALSLARATVGLASPNPQVGCVLVKDGKIIAEGAHIYDHRDHAEIVALTQARHKGIDPAGSTAYVTLEPCAHHGRTPPCSNALIEARIARCVIATSDPNPLVAGQGIRRLRDAGIEVTVGPLQSEARQLNDAFAKFIQHHQPFVSLKAALSADAKLAPPPTQRTPNQPHWITSLESRAQVQQLRHASDAILTGIGTVLADDPALTDRTNLPRRRPLLRVILDTNLRIPLDSQLLRSANDDLLILCSNTTSKQKRATLESRGAEVQPIATTQDGHISLPAVLEVLAKRNILSVLLEAGSHLNAAFLQQNLVDNLILFCAPTTLGEAAIPFAKDINPTQLLGQTHNQTTQTFGPDTCITGYLHNPWPG
jgi:diaminohydroxyphosphoribosylaminopyrimidine deaminase/5-amino-6-(5-phosphoribosylamino)uracil reductase